MQQEGFLGQSRNKPSTIALVAFGHVAVLAAVILTPPEYYPIKVFHPLAIRNIPDTPPPPPETAAPPMPRIARVAEAQPKPVVAPPAETGTPPLAATFDLQPLPRLDPGIGTGPAKIEPAPPPAAPVMVEARFDPRFADRLQPSYPSALARAEIEGMATVRVLIGTDGRVVRVETVSATDPGFAQATGQQALRAWRFRPAMRDGQPIETWLTMTVRFVLDR